MVKSNKDIIKYKFKHDLIEDAFSEVHSSGLISIIFNCKERGLNCHAYDNDMYKFWIEENDDIEDIIYLKSSHTNKIKAGFYLEYISKAKNQI